MTQLIMDAATLGCEQGPATNAHEEQDTAISLRAVLDQYAQRKLPQLRRGEEVRRALQSALLELMDRDIRNLTRREIAAGLDRMAERAPIRANRALAYAKAFFNWAVGRGYLEASPAAAVPKLVREVSRERTPTLAEIAEIWRAAQMVGYPFGPIVQLLILTAARREEVGQMQTDELELPAAELDATWTLPAGRSKNGRAIRVPLSAPARQTLEAALKARQVQGPWVFSTTGRTAFSGWSKAKQRLDRIIAENRRRVGIPENMPSWRLHDIRRAFATAACDVLHIDAAIADRCLNHVGSSTTSTISRVYARSEMLDQRREALKRWAELVMSEIPAA